MMNIVRLPGAIALGLVVCLAPAPATATQPAVKPQALASCPAGKAEPSAGKARSGDPRARAAAQRGLDFLVRATVAWQQGNRCNGCHVQSVTLEALSVGVHHQYRVPRKEMAAIVDGLLNLPGGGRQPGGLSYQQRMYLGTAKSFGGAAFARYDQWVGSDVRHDLLQVAGELLQFQQEDGSITSDYPSHLPVAVGPVQRAFQAAQTWRQAYARTADSKWLLPVQRAEAHLQKTARDLSAQPTANLQEINYALLGLSAAGVGSTEEVMRVLHKRVLSRQNHDGGWGDRATGAGGTGDIQEASNAFATGQALYTLRMLGMTDRDGAIGRGTQWLVQHQQKDGGWGAGGSGKAEAMWGVLGLVSVDVLSVAIKGLEDGQHVGGSMALSAEARDNHSQGGGVQQVELQIDDVLVHRACGPRMQYTWDTARLSAGKHIVDVWARNTKGQTSRRRMEVYAGPVYMTQIGTRADREGTVVSLRDITPGGAAHSVELRVLRPGQQGTADERAVVATLSKSGAQGPLSFTWDGKEKSSKEAPTGKYFARLLYRDAAGKVLQTEDLLFVRDTAENQHKNYGEIQGQLRMRKAMAARAPAAAANARVELVDDRGNVVQSVRSTAEGQYRFKGVDAGKYRVRVRKEGYAPMEQPVNAAPAAEAAANMDL